ncbi:1-deoxy-D-xylulose 5-phosphate reductoisomerase [Clostridium collagenovorans DSM 3089]|uniref:1-deoxy-D-xylulose 5-phosphate reductoisomerase n=1 Tax=Clostridium collagenovorans DSM 3089 TaxID=1121306 RepID=A0A1M5SVQ4_9CLOT|nr:1-deoxy-D-xylulose-5-phosphate reductoisomerase [Clostridium collagenovorans]SHH42555.1 1-deoxy-D-xylulose 5-phosphate reductoisomerase [Clostridium collagenovorans DSM 3089]
MKNISILGVTGSIGTQSLDVIRKNIEEVKLISIAANNSHEEVISIINEFAPKYVAMMSEKATEIIKNYVRENSLDIEVYSGIEGLNKIVTIKEVDLVITSVVGMIGLVPTMEAIKAGKDIALANKETLVAAGDIVMKAAKEYGVKILPVDSEHGAIFQCLRGNEEEKVSRIILTASGGPFRGRKREELVHIKAKEALKHPKWNMGQKISIDSSTLMNKGLEVIEAHWLFNASYDDIEVVVHPQSIIHSMVEYNDGSVMAQLADPDMRLPIQYAINYPKREEKVIKPLDFSKISTLTFEKPDMDTFRCLKIAYEAGKQGGNCTAIMNTANEMAVELFLKDKIGYLDIENIIEDSLNTFEYVSNPTLEEIIELDRKVREYIIKTYNA